MSCRTLFVVRFTEVWSDSQGKDLPVAGCELNVLALDVEAAIAKLRSVRCGVADAALGTITELVITNVNILARVEIE